MTPAARLQAAIDILDCIVTSSRNNGAAADVLIADWFKSHRFAGSGDRRAVREFVYRAIRAHWTCPENGRAAMAALAVIDADISALFDGSRYGPSELLPNEGVPADDQPPAWMKQQFDALIDADETAALLERAPTDLRVNRLKAERDAMLSVFPESRPIAHTRDGLRLSDQIVLDAIPAYRDGLVEVQDAGSQLIADLCDARPGMTVIDLCAGAGGKTLALAADMKGEGQLIACDANRQRLRHLIPRAERAGASFIETRLLDPGTERKDLGDLHKAADVVLVDAPCSGSGTWRRNPETRWRLTPARLDATVRTQRHLLSVAGELVKPGGALVYAVCSVFSVEGREAISAFLSANPGWEANPRTGFPGRPSGNGTLFTPHHDQTDGFFVARLARAC